VVVEKDQPQRMTLLDTLCCGIVVLVAVAVDASAIDIVTIGRGGGGQKALTPGI
jgi:hypothetical protein